MVVNWLLTRSVMTASKNWKAIEIKHWDDLDHVNYWEQGFFHLDSDGKGTTYQRDFDELRQRDLSLFTLGQIENKVILDMGCGSGLYSLTFLKLGAKEVCGQDILKDAINEASSKASSKGFSNFTGKVGDCEELQFEEDKFDLVFAGDIFEHITRKSKNKFIIEAYRVLKPGGLFTIKTPNKSYLKFTNLLHRIKALIKLQNPFSIHIAHTRNNPDNEHLGLTTHEELMSIFENTMFHHPVITKTDLNKSLPYWLSKILRRYLMFNPQIILTVQKPIFYGIYK